jgi:hypothetical protein
VKRVRLGILLGVGVLGLVAALASQGCSDSAPANSEFVPADAGGYDLWQPTPTLEGGPGGLLACAKAEAKAKRVPVYMLIILDGSGSMAQANKWLSVVPALDAIFDELFVEQSPAFGIGFTIFGDANDPTISDFNAGPYDKMDVSLRFVDKAQHAALRARVDLTAPNLGTPTYEVLHGQFPLMEAFKPKAPLDPGGRRVVVFMTDGVPDTDMPAGQNEQPWSLKLAQDEFAKVAPAGPITTFAVGVGPLGAPPPDAGRVDYDPRFLGALAMAGGAPNLPCDPNEMNDPNNMCHFQITPGGKSAAQLEQEFIATIDKIRTEVLSCEFTLEKTGQPLDPTLVNVVYTECSGMQTLLAEDPGDGWTYDNPGNPSKVILHGASCAKVKSDPCANIDIVVGCRTIIK